jgi:ubiquinone/menaquinone biosynthesis C-methylase UbiE
MKKIVLRKSQNSDIINQLLLKYIDVFSIDVLFKSNKSTSVKELESSKVIELIEFYDTQENFLIKSYISLKILVFKVLNKNLIILDSEILFGRLGKEKQIDEFDKLLLFFDIIKDKKEVECSISNLFNSDKRFYQEFITEAVNNNFLNLKASSFYDSYWKFNKTKKGNWVYGINIVDNLINNFNFKTVLDAGCGTGDVVRYLLSKGYDAYGAEISKAAIVANAKDLFDSKRIVNCSLSNLPFKDNHFDVVFTSEVLEHIPEDEIPSVLKELNRVSKNIVFATISLRPSSNFNKYHCTVKSREWWENQFVDQNFEKLKDVVDLLQQKGYYDFEQVLMTGPTKTHIHEMEWFIKRQPFSFNGELEPWYFVFRKNVK